MSVVIFGKGRVGIATKVALGLDPDWIDPEHGLDIKTTKGYDIAIVCVPSLEDGAYDHAILDGCLERLSSDGFDGVVAIRCTVSPIWLNDAVTNYSNLSIIHFPEFMIQREYKEINDKPWCIVLGGDKEHTKPFGEWLKDRGYAKADPEFMYTSHKESALIKLSQNAFLASKVTIFNVINEMCKVHGADFETVRKGVAIDDRIGDGHTHVPGWDGKLGFGGHCFPKDIRCLAALDYGGNLWDTIININNKVRN